MNRRRFTLLVSAAAGVGFSLPLGKVAAIPTVEAGPEDFREVMYRNPDPNGDYRTAFVRVSIWVDEPAAIAHATRVVSEPGSDLPDGEFYQNEPTAIPAPQLPEDVFVGGWSWHTTVGVAAFVTGFGLAALRRGTMIWDIMVSTGSEGAAIALVRDLAVACAEAKMAPCGGLDSYLPDPAVFPADLALEHTRTPDGMVDAEGNPVEYDSAPAPAIPVFDIASPEAPTACGG